MTDDVQVAKAIGGTIVAVVAITCIFEENLWPTAIISIALAIFGLLLVFFRNEKKKFI